MLCNITFWQIENLFFWSLAQLFDALLILLHDTPTKSSLEHWAAYILYHFLRSLQKLSRILHNGRSWITYFWAEKFKTLTITTCLWAKYYWAFTSKKIFLYKELSVNISLERKAASVMACLRLSLVTYCWHETCHHGLNTCTISPLCNSHSFSLICEGLDLKPKYPLISILKWGRSGSILYIF